MCMWRACCVKEWWRVDWPRRADCLGAYRRSPVLLRRMIQGHLRRSRPEKSLNVSQRIRLRYFSGLRPCIWPRLLRLATKGFSDRLLGCARGGGRTGTPRRLPYDLGVSDTPAHSSDALRRSQSVHPSPLKGEGRVRGAACHCERSEAISVRPEPVEGCRLMSLPLSLNSSERRVISSATDCPAP